MKKSPAYYEGAAEQAEQASRWLEAIQYWAMAINLSNHARREHYLYRSRLANYQAAADWNQHHPVGTQVRYWSGVREGTGQPSVTRSPAWILPSGAAVILVEGQAGAIALSHIDRIQEPR